MLTFVVAVTAGLAVFAFLFLVLGSFKDVREDDVPTYVCDTCGKSECVCRREDG